ncbi:tubulin binding cofactor C-domain-containing protein [Trametes punicea]|nr:tubulin binding cofactor C-domain-containing protein [Trametes punicea]
MAETNQELIQQFYTRFRAASAELLAQLESLRGGPATSEAVEYLAAETAKLRKDVTDAIAFLPGYDQRQCESVRRLKDIEARLEALRASTSPKAKFSFRRKANPAPSTPPSDKVVPSSTPTRPSDEVKASSGPVESGLPTSGLRLSGRTHSYLTVASLSAPWSAASDLTISDVDNCIINLIPSIANPNVAAEVTFTALHVRNVSNSVLVLPVISGSALLHDIKNCVIALGSRQFRMHTSSQVDVYISIASNPIIEHCSEIRFADYPSCLMPESSTDVVQNAKSNYLAVQDFSHIRATPSPNWSALPADQTIADAAWPLAPQDTTDILHELLPACYK